MTDTPTWREDGELIDNAGDINGDIQCGAAYERRFLHTTLPGRLVDIAAYPIKGDGSDPMPDEDAPIRLEVQTELMVCRDTDDPGGTAIWSDYTYTTGNDLPERFDVDYVSVEAAEAAARRYVEQFDPALHLSWDGAPDADKD
jgi:hypothetical protein